MKFTRLKIAALALLAICGVTPVAHAENTQGATANGSASKGNPVWTAGWDGSLIHAFLTDSTGRILIGNFPSSFTVSNFPGSFSVSNFPTTFGVTALPSLPTGANTIGTVAVNNFPSSFSVSNFPTSFGVTSLPSLPAGSNLIGAVTQSGGPWAITGAITSLPSLPAGTAVIGHVITDSGSTTTLTGSATVVQPTGSNLHVVVDTAPTTTVTGSVSVTNLPATQAVSVASLPLPAGAATAANQAAPGTAGSPSAQVVSVQGVTSGTAVKVDGSGVTQPVSAATLPLPTGAAQDATLTGGTAQTRLTDGTNIANVVAPGNGQNAVLTAPNFQEVAFSTTTVASVGFTNTNNYHTVSVQVSSQGGSSTVAFQVSNDNSTWFNLPLTIATNLGNSAAAVSTTTTGIWVGGLNFHYFRLNVTGIASGTTSGVIDFSSAVTPVITPQPPTIPVSQSGTWTLPPTTTGGLLIYKLISASGTNAALVKSGNGQLYAYSLANTTASFKFVHIYNLTVAPTVGTSIPVSTIAIPPNSVSMLDVAAGAANGIGISISVTGAAADTDVTAVAAGDVVGTLYYK